MKRTRAPNFITAEIMHLLRLVEQYPVIENKKTDGVTAKEKQEAWKKLAADYNSQTNFAPRAVENLIACYKNQKIKAKKAHSSEKMTIKAPLLLLDAVEEHGQDWDKVAQATNENMIDCQMSFNRLVKEAKREEASHKKEVNRTGGGPPPQPPCSGSDAVLQKVKTLIGPSLEGLFTAYDGDAEFMKEQQLLLPIDMQISPIEYTVENSQQIENDKAPNKQTQDFKRLNIMKKKIDPSLESEKKGKKKLVSHSFQELAEDKKQLVKAQVELLARQKQHQELEIKLLEERLSFEKTKNKMEIDFLKEKYELELNCLKNKKQE